MSAGMSEASAAPSASLFALLVFMASKMPGEQCGAACGGGALQLCSPIKYRIAAGKAGGQCVCVLQERAQQH